MVNSFLLSYTRSRCENNVCQLFPFKWKAKYLYRFFTSNDINYILFSAIRNEICIYQNFSLFFILGIKIIAPAFSIQETWFPTNFYQIVRHSHTFKRLASQGMLASCLFCVFKSRFRSIDIGKFSVKPIAEVDSYYLVTNTSRTRDRDLIVDEM